MVGKQEAVSVRLIHEVGDAGYSYAGYSYAGCSYAFKWQIIQNNGRTQKCWVNLAPL